MQKVHLQGHGIPLPDFMDCPTLDDVYEAGIRFGYPFMLKNKKLARHIQDCSWYQFQTFLKYKCDWYGKNFIQIGRFEPSSKLCTCGNVNHELKLKDRTWTCSVCKTKHDRDILASNNIKQIGLGQPKFTPVENYNSDSSEAGNPIPLGVG
jgi:putative transposase